MLTALNQLRSRALVIRVEGKLCWQVADSVAKTVKSMSWRLPRVLAVSVNCAQGSLVQADVIASTLKAAAKKHNVPLYTFAEDFAIGPGYWVLAAGDKVFADNYSLIGGVSVAVQGLGLTGFAKQWKLETSVVASGKNRLRLNSFEKVKAEDEDWLKGLLKEHHAGFQDYVKKCRPQANADGLVGDVFKGSKAAQLGLIDELGEQHTILHRDFPGVKAWNRGGSKMRGCPKMQDLLVKAQTEGVEESEVLDLLDSEWTRTISQRMLADV